MLWRIINKKQLKKYGLKLERMLPHPFLVYWWAKNHFHTRLLQHSGLNFAHKYKILVYG